MKNVVRNTIFVVGYTGLTVLIVLSVLNCFIKLKGSQEDSMISDMELEVVQQASSLKTEILQEQTHLLEMRQIISDKGVRDLSTEEKIDMLRPVAAIDSFIRVSIADKNGIALTSDGFTIDIAFREFFQEAIKGNMYISGRIDDSIIDKDGDIVVFSAPLYDEDDKINGVIFETLSVEQFEDKLDVDALGRMGCSAIVEANGRVIVATDNPMLGRGGEYDNIFDFASNAKNADDIMDDLRNGVSGYVYLELDEGKYVYFAPIEVDDFAEQAFIVSVVSSDMLGNRLSEIMYDIPRMLGICAICIVLISLLFMHDRRIRRAERIAELNQIAYVDELTEGPNYNAFKKSAEKIKSNGFIVSMDIHAFRTINAVCGTEIGDEVIKGVWKTIEKLLVGQEIAAHVNADHFVILMLENSEYDVSERLDEITSMLGVVAIRLGTPQIVPYFGVSSWKSGEPIEEAENKSITARHMVKVKSDSNYVFFTEKESANIIERKKIEDSFDDAIANDEFKVWYQPKYNPANNRIVGAEALVRWVKNNGDILPPGKFIPVFEKNGSIRELDEYVYNKVCKAQRKWYEEGVPIVPISVNLSRASVYFSDVVDKYSNIAKESGVEPNDVPIEITESAAIADGSIRSTVNSLAIAGFPLHMDDFGTGYSSLSTLVNMKLDTVKIDKSLTDTIGENAGERLVKHSIILAKELGLKVTAEGAETQEQVDFLRDVGCDSIQGYFYSKPVPYADFDNMLKSQAGVNVG